MRVGGVALEKQDLGGPMLNAENVHLDGSGNPYPDGRDRGRDHPACAFVDQARERRTRSGYAPHQEGQAVLRVEGAHRRGREAGPPLLEEAAFSEEVFLPVTFSEFLRFYDNAAD